VEKSEGKKHLGEPGVGGMIILSWTNIKIAILETATEKTGEQRKERNQNCYDEDCQTAMKEKRS
jgi:hypothetical protein